MGMTQQEQLRPKHTSSGTGKPKRQTEHVGRKQWTGGGNRRRREPQSYSDEPRKHNAATESPAAAIVFPCTEHCHAHQ